VGIDRQIGFSNPKLFTVLSIHTVFTPRDNNHTTKEFSLS